MGKQNLRWHSIGYYGDRVAVSDPANKSYPAIKLDLHMSSTRNGREYSKEVTCTTPEENLVCVMNVQSDRFQQYTFWRRKSDGYHKENPG